MRIAFLGQSARSPTAMMTLYGASVGMLRRTRGHHLRLFSVASKTRPFKGLRVSAVKEIHKDETRVALSPAATANLVKRGVDVQIEQSAGVLASFQDDDYAKAGAKIVDKSVAFQADVVLKVILGCLKYFLLSVIFIQQNFLF